MENENIIKSTMSEQDLGELKNQFAKEISCYIPDWKRIITANQTNENLKYDEIIDRKVEIFRKRMHDMRKDRGLTQAQMAERLSCTKQYISKIEKNINRIPVERLADINRIFGVPIPYLLGLTDSEEIIPKNEEIYFWENPKSKYSVIKDDVIKEPYINPMIFWGPPSETLADKVLEKIKDDYAILTLLDDILKSSKEKREKILKSVKFLMEIL